jgi:NAD(P)-dependent dehydrogenase (short-subunit alcohol dehydrogenase family)
VSVIIGKETAKVLLEHNAKVYIGCRSAEKARTAVEELKSITGKTDDDLKVLSMDLSNLRTIKTAVDEFLKYVPAPEPATFTSARFASASLTAMFFGYTQIRK